MKKIVVDCSHANSNKDHTRQAAVFNDVVSQIVEGNKTLCGVMIESHLFAGNQEIPSDVSKLKYGISVTDACIDWPITEKMILNALPLLTIT